MVLGLLVTLACAGVAYTVLAPEPTSRFCTTGLAFREVGGRSVQLQDQGAPGRDGCDGDELAPGSRSEVLGYDCRVRSASGDVVETVGPNRPDGTCGQGDR
ncbi:hypothetical protein BH10ACT1_BH10ACT1_02390 [soil metagenome]